MKRASAKMRLLPAIAMILVCAISAAGADEQRCSRGGAPVFSPDKGKLVIQLNGETIGSEQFELTQTGNNWLAKGTTELKVPGTDGRHQRQRNIDVTTGRRAHQLRVDFARGQNQWSTRGFFQRYGENYFADAGSAPVRARPFIQRPGDCGAGQQSVSPVRAVGEIV